MTAAVGCVAGAAMQPEFRRLLPANYGPALKASQALTGDARRAFRDDLIALATASNHATDGTLASDWEYLITIATKT